MVKVHVFVNESSHSSWTEIFGEPGGLQEHELRRNSELILDHTEIDIRAFWRNSECGRDWKCISFMDEISIFSGSSDPVDKSKSTCLLRFRTMSGEDEWQQRCNYKMERSSGRIQKIEFEWNNLPGFSSMQILQKIQDDLRERNIELEKFTDRIIFMSMLFRVRNTGRFSVLETKRSCMELFLFHLKENGTLPTATQMVERLKDTSHPLFKSISALSRGILKKKN